MKTLDIDGYHISITENNIHIENSYNVSTEAEMRKILFSALPYTKITRSTTSCIREWKAHNVLYRWNIARSRTADVDINENETNFHKLCYFFLSLLF